MAKKKPDPQKSTTRSYYPSWNNLADSPILVAGMVAEMRKMQPAKPRPPARARGDDGWQTRRETFIRGVMTKRGLSMAGLARKARVDPSTVYRFINGKNPRLGVHPGDAKVRILKALNLSVLEIPE